MRGTILDPGTSPSCTYRSEYPESEIHPLVCLVKTENGQRDWREREDPPVQAICMNAASKVGSGSDRPESRSWPICLAMTAPALVLLSRKGQLGEILGGGGIPVMREPYAVSAICPEMRLLISCLGK